MKLNAKALRYLNSDDFRVLSAAEVGMKNHEVVPVTLIAQISNIKHGGLNKIIGELARLKLLARMQNIKYDGYRLTYGGYDYLALKTFSKRGSVASVGQQIGIGKESDVHLVADENGAQYILKLQRLGRTSFRSVHTNRDYYSQKPTTHSKTAHWFHISRLASLKEYIFLKTLYENGFPVPKPIDYNRHAIVMELVDSGVPLYQLKKEELADTEELITYLFNEMMDLIVRLAKCGLIHGDFNEFNLLIKPVPDFEPEDPYNEEQVKEAEKLNNEKPPFQIIMIDFPQMVSTMHVNAKYYFDRDVECVRRFFRKRFGYQVDDDQVPVFDHDSMVENKDIALDVVAEASGFSKKKQKEFECLMGDIEESKSIQEREDSSVSEDDSEEEEEKSEDNEKESEDDESGSESNSQECTIEIKGKIQQDEISDKIQSMNMNDDDVQSRFSQQTWWDNHKSLPLRDLVTPTEREPFDPLAYRQKRTANPKSKPVNMARKIFTRNNMKSKEQIQAKYNAKNYNVGW